MTTTDQLKTLHTAAIDAANGYREALKEAEGKGMTPLFSEMVSLHDAHATQLASLIKDAGIEPDSDGSFMTVVHRTIMDVRSLFSGLDASVLPGLIDGEQRNLAKYDAALKEPLPAPYNRIFEGQRGDLQARIEKMKSIEKMKVT